MNGPCSIANFWIPKGYCEVRLLEDAPVWPPNCSSLTWKRKTSIFLSFLFWSCANSTIKKQNTLDSSVMVIEFHILAPMFNVSNRIFPGSNECFKETRHFQQNWCPSPLRQETKNLSSDWNMPGQDAQVVARRFVVYLCHDHYDP